MPNGVARELVGIILPVDAALSHALVSLQCVFSRKPGVANEHPSTAQTTNPLTLSCTTDTCVACLPTSQVTSAPDPHDLESPKLTLCVSICLFKSCARENAAPH